MKGYTGTRSASNKRDARILNRTLHAEGYRCCHSCFTIMPKTKEHFHVKNGTQLSANCKPCTSVKARGIKLRQKSDPKWYCSRLTTAVKSRARASGLEFNLSPNHLHETLLAQGGLCYYTGMVLDFTVENTDTSSPHREMPSVDKLTPSLGYTEGNVVWCLYYVNRMKCDLSEEEFKELCKQVIKHTLA